MNKYRFFYFYWIIPLFLLFMAGQQFLVYQGVNHTYKNGTSYLAEVVDFERKQIVTQNSAFIDIKFEADGELIERRLSLSMEMVQKLIQSSNFPIRYLEGAHQEIVPYPTYTIQKSTSLFNVSVALISFIIMAGFGIPVNRFIKRKTQNESADRFEIERVD